MTTDDAQPTDGTEAEPAGASKGRGVTPGPKKAARATDARAAKKIKGRTLYVPDDLWERVIVQSHRRGRTYSEYVCSILERQVPDHRVIRADLPDDPA